MTDPKPALGAVIDEASADLAFSRATVSIVLTNPNVDDNPIVYINEAFEELTGYAKSAVVGRNCRFLQGPDTDPADVARIRDAIRAREEVAIDLLNYRADGEAFLNRLLLAPVFGEGGQVQYFLGLQKEMTARDVEDAGGRAAAADRMRAVQSRVRAHLAGVIDTILDHPNAGCSERELLSLNRRIETLQFLYEEMIRPAPFGRNDGRVALGAYIARVGNALAHVEGRPGIRVNIASVDLAAGVDVSTRLGLLASELLTNALRHAFEGRAFGSVELRVVTLAQGGLRMTVADDGIGIPEGEPFPAGGARGGRIVRRLIEGMAASIAVSRGLAGTVVTVDVGADALAGGGGARCGTVTAGE
ncbi:PAS domain S-box-containing protein [Hasllibacter halocynthiae]|uniref:PAS domain S-box-containing protein n=1 Tax=Hasllibacter halocynthiae TaxID=595589 RepID=A0A2T0X9L9_9RHOB|nr:PAS domain-containing protein [Hasllibacter halocynthiae]PRY95615.1 PAS domain S-box-containing protein [Hasllibacter halocynthiae]